MSRNPIVKESLETINAVDAKTCPNQSKNKAAEENYEEDDGFLSLSSLMGLYYKQSVTNLSKSLPFFRAKPKSKKDREEVWTSNPSLNRSFANAANAPNTRNDKSNNLNNDDISSLSSSSSHNCSTNDRSGSSSKNFMFNIKDENDAMNLNEHMKSHFEISCNGDASSPSSLTSTDTTNDGEGVIVIDEELRPVDTTVLIANCFIKSIVLPRIEHVHSVHAAFIQNVLEENSLSNFAIGQSGTDDNDQTSNILSAGSSNDLIRGSGGFATRNSSNTTDLQISPKVIQSIHDKVAALNYDFIDYLSILKKACKKFDRCPPSAFKSSSLKDSTILSHVGTNVNLHYTLVRNLNKQGVNRSYGKTRKEETEVMIRSDDKQVGNMQGGSGEEEPDYLTSITFGAPACHSLGFKSGGVRVLRKKIRALSNQFDVEVDRPCSVSSSFACLPSSSLTPSYNNKNDAAKKISGLAGSCAVIGGDIDDSDDEEEDEPPSPDSPPTPASPSSISSSIGSNIASSRNSRNSSNGVISSDIGGADILDYLKLKRMQLNYEARSSAVIGQAISGIIAASMDLLNRCLTQRNSDMLKQFYRVGLLVHSVSLLSTSGREEGMIDDFAGSLEFLSKANMQLRILPPDPSLKLRPKAATRVSVLLRGVQGSRTTNVLGGLQFESIESAVPHLLSGGEERGEEVVEEETAIRLDSTSVIGRKARRSKHGDNGTPFSKQGKKERDFIRCNLLQNNLKFVNKSSNQQNNKQTDVGVNAGDGDNDGRGLDEMMHGGVTVEGCEDGGEIMGKLIVNISVASQDTYEWIASHVFPTPSSTSSPSSATSRTSSSRPEFVKMASTLTSLNTVQSVSNENQNCDNGTHVPTIPIVPILFNLGVNALQSLANQTGSTEIQTQLNRKGVKLLQSYYNTLESYLSKREEEEFFSSSQAMLPIRLHEDASMYMSTFDALGFRTPYEFTHSPKDSSTNSSSGVNKLINTPNDSIIQNVQNTETEDALNELNKEELIKQRHKKKRNFKRSSSVTIGEDGSVMLSEIQVLINELHELVELEAEKKLKNSELLLCCSKIVRKLNGCRTSSCKSAKDRTSMFQTLEVVRSAEARGFIPKSMEQKVLDQLRGVEGVRLRNCGVNIGKKLYTFNQLHYQSMPSELKPPPGTFFAGET